MSLTVNICGEIAKYDAVRLINCPPENPIQPGVVVDEDALLCHTVRHHPNTQQKHEEEQIRHLRGGGKDTSMKNIAR